MITVLFIVLIQNFLFSLSLKRIFSKIKHVLPLILILVIFLPLYIGNTIAFRLELGFPIFFYWEGINLAILLFFRIFISIFVFMSFFSTLTYSEFIEALTRMPIPSFLVGSFIILLHYIPILAKSNRKILDAQMLRGKKVTSYWLKLKAHAFIMAKSLVLNMDRSERLYESLKMRGFSGEITFAPRKVKWMDIMILLVFILVMLFLIFFIDLKTLYTELMLLFIR